jgi:hypothetical protein
VQRRSSDTVKIFSPPYSREELIERLRERMPALQERLPLTQVVLLGSWAAGTATAFSDVDLLIVYADLLRDDAYSIIWRTLELRGLEPHVYTQSEAEQVGSLERMRQDGVVLFG